jgi:hypothetical protein
MAVVVVMGFFDIDRSKPRLIVEPACVKRYKRSKKMFNGVGYTFCFSGCILLFYSTYGMVVGRR